MRKPWLLFASLIACPLVASAAPPQAPEVPAAPTAVPSQPAPDDGMLAPVADAPVVLASWGDALTHLRARSTDLRVAALEVERADAQSRQALAALIPTLSASAIGTHNFLTNSSAQISGLGANGLPTFTQFQTPTPNYATGNAVLVAPLVAPRAWNALKTASLGVEVAKHSQDDVKRNIALTVAGAVVTVVTSERIAELNRVGLRSALQRLELTKRKGALGAATGLDVVRAKQDVESARATLVSGDESLRQAREALGLALGVAGPVGVARGLDLDALARATLATCQAAPSIEDRPDVAAARTRVEIARQAVKDVRAAFAPTLAAQSTVATTTIDTGAAPNTTWNIQAVLSWNLFDGGVRYAQLRDTSAQQDEASERLEALRRSATVQYEQARRGVDVAEQSRKVASSARDLAAETDRLTQAGYLGGLGTSLELVTAASALRQAEINLAVQEFGVVRAKLLALLNLATCPY